MSESTITINPTIKIDLPTDKIIVSKSEYDELVKKADMSGWWGLDELEKRYGHGRKWFVDNVFAPFERKLRDRIVMYPYGGKSTYWVKPKEFVYFMDMHFSEICRKVGA
ncbi:DUF771 domain-containing protein [Lapidilactobacillus luobeiensis]|uniref:DUF771 domain-containing protein n=1 Tax=Lapidilactobacillus luobeiensis TaxID=2950371 RepID=UPI0021C470FD|nr:DUF771 domain-containing protein [Lapidilactobacillus luobeiensis]